jgi:nucleotide-binding universal stress UspA family protein
MKFRPSSKDGGVLVELAPNEVQLPAESFAFTSPLAEFNLKTILVPVDFSNCSDKALHYAVPFARQFGAEITLLHVIEYSREFPEVIMANTGEIHHAEEELEDLLRSVNGTVACRAILRVGKPAAEIVAAAAQSGADLILLSTHGRSGYAHVILGSTTERVVRNAPCPVLVVREHEHEFVVGSPGLLPRRAEPLIRQ